MAVEKAPIKMKYKDIGGFKFVNMISKISSAPTSNKNACHIHNIVKRINQVREKMLADFDKELTQVYAKKDEKGKLIDDGQGGLEIIDDKRDEFLKKQDEFGEREFTIDYRPLTPTVLADVKLTAEDIGQLGPLFTEQESGPDLPHQLVGMPGVGREVRRAESHA
jgi:hypothetical protein